MYKQAFDLLVKLGKTSGSADTAYYISLSSNFNLIQREIVKWLELQVELYRITMEYQKLTNEPLKFKQDYKTCQSERKEIEE